MIKLCECGCGEPTKLANQTHPKRGIFKGQPNRFIFGHHCKVLAPRREKSPQWRGGKSRTSGGYETTFLPEYHRADTRGYVLTHILIAEKVMGKHLPPGAEVHHHTKTQLVICQDRTYHRLMHRRMNALRACGDVHWQKCCLCKTYDSVENLRRRVDGISFYHISCKNKASRDDYAKVQGGTVRPWGRGRKCNVPGCDKDHLSRGLCVAHYNKFKRHKALFLEEMSVLKGMKITDAGTGEILREATRG